MGSQLGGEAFFRFSHIRLSPQVAHFLLAAQPEVFPCHAALSVLGADVEESHCHRAVFKRLGEYDHIAILRHYHRLDAERILIDFDHLVVGEQA